MVRRPQIIRSLSHVAVGLLFARLSGFLKHFMIVKYFGLSYDADVFFVANTISDVIMNILLAGMLTGAFIPIATEVLVKHGHTRFSEFVTLILVVVGSCLLIASLVLFFFSYEIGTAIAPGYEKEQHLVISKIFRILAPGILFIGLAGILRGIMQVMEQFLLPAYGLFIANTTTIVFTILFHNKYGIIAPAVGTTIGFILWSVILIPPTIRWFRIASIKEVISHYLKRFTTYAGLAMAVMFVANVILLIEKAVASEYPEGTISHLNLAYRLARVFLNLLVVPFSVVLLPKLSKYFGKKNFLDMHRVLKGALSIITMLLFSLLSFIILNNYLVTRLVYGLTGISTDSLSIISKYLAIYSISFIGMCFYSILLTLMYSLQQGKQLLVANIFGLIAYIITVFALGDVLKIVALPIAYSAYAIATTLYIFVFLRIRIFTTTPPLLERYLFSSGGFLLASTLIVKFYFHWDNYLNLFVFGILVAIYFRFLKQKGFFSIVHLEERT